MPLDTLSRNSSGNRALIWKLVNFFVFAIETVMFSFCLHHSGMRWMYEARIRYKSDTKLNGWKKQVDSVQCSHIYAHEIAAAIWCSTSIFVLSIGDRSACISSLCAAAHRLRSAVMLRSTVCRCEWVPMPTENVLLLLYYLFIYLLFFRCPKKKIHKQNAGYAESQLRRHWSHM